MATSGSQRRKDRDPIDPLTHPLRRRIMRYLHSWGQPKGAREVALALAEVMALLEADEADDEGRKAA